MALRAMYEGVGEAECDREPNFQELYPLLGDKQAQDQVRAWSQAHHCSFLELNPSACTTCLFSPYRGEKGPLHIAREKWMWLLEEAETLDLQISLNPSAHLTDTQFAALLTLRREHRILEAMLI
ncbi:MAG: hypothetical protein V1792_28700, partial [Pseudomonadota bacterium]